MFLTCFDMFFSMNETVLLKRIRESAFSKMKNVVSATNFQLFPNDEKNAVSSKC